MENQVLTIEQMKHLRELGCDTSGASMKFISTYFSCDTGEMEDGDFIPVDTGFYAKFYNEGGLTFTLQDVLEGIRTITGEQCYPRLFLNEEGQWTCCYADKHRSDKMYMQDAHTPLEAAYRTLSWILEVKSS